VFGTGALYNLTLQIYEKKQFDARAAKILGFMWQVAPWRTPVVCRGFHLPIDGVCPTATRKDIFFETRQGKRNGSFGRDQSPER
jgi:hypothetical protein